MVVANSFDLWKKDVFFSAAEEVQQSADIMESTYRAWARVRKESVAQEVLDELCRELQTALGTAKWQLDEFEKAVRSSHCQRGDDHTTARHRQFISAIENQISRVETELSASLSAEGKKHLRWVELDEEECDDLAAFLSGTSHCIPIAKIEHVELGPSVRNYVEKPTRRKDVDVKSNAACSLDISDEGAKDTAITMKDPHFLMGLNGKERPGTRDDIIYHADRTTNTRKTWGSPNCELRVIIPDEAEQRTQLMPSFELEDTSKEKGSKLVFWRRCGELHQAKEAVNFLYQIFCRVGASQNQSQSPQNRWQSPVRLRIGHPVQVTLTLMLTFFLLVPFMFYSS